MTTIQYLGTCSSAQCFSRLALNSGRRRTKSSNEFMAGNQHLPIEDKKLSRRSRNSELLLREKMLDYGENIVLEEAERSR